MGVGEGPVKVFGLEDLKFRFLTLFPKKVLYVVTNTHASHSTLNSCPIIEPYHLLRCKLIKEK